jgi:hypothetical protein
MRVSRSDAARSCRTPVGLLFGRHRTGGKGERIVANKLSFHGKVPATCLMLGASRH